MTRCRGAPRLDEQAARDILLLQAFESIEPPSPSWTAEDAAWATRAAREAGGSADGSRFLAARAALALQRLLPREPALAGAGRWHVGHARRLAAAIAVGTLVGLSADAIGSSQRINLLAPPVWTVVVWNLIVYLLLLVALARGVAGTRDERPGALVRIAGRLLPGGDPRLSTDGATPAPAAAGSTAAALRFFAARWAVVAAPLAARRAATLLHAAAAALGTALVAGLYARGLVLDYRVAWESTFLSPSAVHAALSTLLAPASWLSGIALPDVAAVAALRAAHGDAAVGAPAAPWIHLYAWTLAITVVLPRAALAALGAARSRQAARHLPLPLDDAYFRRLDHDRRGEVVRAVLSPYAQPPTAAALGGARALLAEVLGAGLTLDVEPTTPLGGEDDVGATSPLAAASGASVVVALFDLGATPEPEHQGRFVDALAARASAARAALIVMIDESAFRSRFGSEGRRLAERRAAWTALLAARGTVAVFATLATADHAAAVVALRRAVASPLPPRR